MHRLNIEEKLNVLHRCVDASINGVIITKTTEEDFEIIFANKRFLAITGYSMDEVLGRNGKFLNGKMTSRKSLKQLKQSILDEKDIEIRLISYRKNGEQFWNSLYVSPVYDSHQELINYIGIINDITEDVALQNRLEFNAKFDSLTELVNRQTLEEEIAQTHKQALSEKSAYYIIFIDLDEFKSINDTMGHSVGDAVLKSVSGRLKSISRNLDMIARIGGDEFVMLLKNVSEKADVTKIAERIIEKISEPIKVNNHTLQISASLGIASNHHATYDPDEVLRNADMAMYKAKNSGRNQYCYFNDELSDNLRQRQHAKSLISLSLLGDHFHLIYQPIIECEEQTIFAAEAKLGLQVNNQTLAHGEIFKVSDTSGQLFRVNEILVSKAVRSYFINSKNSHVPIPLLIPIYKNYFKHHDFSKNVGQIFADYASQDHLIYFVLPDGLLTDDELETRSKINTLLDLGVKICLCNLSNSFAILRNMDEKIISAITVTKALTKNTRDSLIDRTIMESLIKIGRQLSIDIIFSGVDKNQQLSALRDIGAELITGRVFKASTSLAVLKEHYSQHCQNAI
ncbi:diguanylate cyclase domain-containing protein [Methylophaga sp. OBS4]|uniref:diguanylate cyclase domain-containing protein n=1 Tax=Methylophaga sp. OBS4 TaxID=2991935 RepID=UPI002255903E|nr:diguanylate cyclase [Methylophaga sp. OBS4]MCX4186224.1 diguanylate cyclase [Methylophaga sp. OBS4]